MRLYNDTDHRQCRAVDEHGLGCAGPEGHVPPHANINGEFGVTSETYDRALADIFGGVSAAGETSEPLDAENRRYNTAALYPTEGGLYGASFGLCDHHIEPGDHDDVERAAVAHMRDCPPDQPVEINR